MWVVFANTKLCSNVSRTLLYDQSGFYIIFNDLADASSKLTDEDHQKQFITQEPTTLTIANVPIKV